MSTSNKPARGGQASSAWRTFKDRDEWIAAMLAAPDLSWRAQVIATRIALHHNVKTGQCDPSMVGLAAGCGVSENTVRSTIKVLEATGWLRVDRSRGHRRNAFQLLAPTLQTCCRVEPFKHAEGLPFKHVEGFDDSPTLQESEAYPSSTLKGNPSSTLHPNSEGTANLLEQRRGDAPKKRGTRSRSMRRRQTLWPDGFHLTDAMADLAADKAGWDQGRAFAEFERFENYHRSKGSAFADWEAAWRTWVSNGKRYDRERDAQQAPVIDQHGNPAGGFRPDREPFRRRSNTEFALMNMALRAQEEASNG
jgi:hypothetical protein